MSTIKKVQKKLSDYGTEVQTLNLSECKVEGDIDR